MDLTNKEDLDKALELSCISLNGSSITIEKARPKGSNINKPTGGKHQGGQQASKKEKTPRNTEDWTFGGDDSKKF